MKIAANILVVVVALEHLLFLVLEMFLWTSPTGLRTFGMTPDVAESSATLAANQGLYNGFLAAGLLWGLSRRNDNYATVLFFLGCVIVAGAFGGMTAKASILFVQGAPALIALLLVLLARQSSPAELTP